MKTQKMYSVLISVLSFFVLCAYTPQVFAVDRTEALKAEFKKSNKELADTVKDTKSYIGSFDEHDDWFINSSIGELIDDLDNDRDISYDRIQEVKSELEEDVKPRKDRIVKLHRKTQRLHERLTSFGVTDFNFDTDVENHLSQAGFIKVGEKYLPRAAWYRILDLGYANDLNFETLKGLEREVLKRDHKARKKIAEENPIIKYYRIGKQVYKVNCTTGEVERVDANRKIEKTQSGWSQVGNALKEIGRGLLTTAVVGAELYRPYLQNKQSKEAWKSWRDSAVFAQNYGYPVPPTPLLPPIAPINLTSMFDLLGVGPQPTKFERMFMSMNGQGQGSMNPWQQQNLLYNMQLMQRNGMNPMTGQPMFNNSGDPMANMMQQLNGIMSALPQQLSTIEQATQSMNERLTIEREALSNQLQTFEAAQAALSGLQRLSPDLQGAMNQFRTGLQNYNRALNRHTNASQSYNQRVTYDANGSGSFGGRFGGGGFPQQ